MEVQVWDRGISKPIVRRRSSEEGVTTMLRWHWAILVATFTVACSSPATTNEKVVPATPQIVVATTTAPALPPTPNAQATVEVAVKATIAAQPPTVPTRAAEPAKPAVPSPATMKVEATQIIYRKTNNVVVVEGIVENQGSATVGTIQIAISLIADDGKTAGSAEAFTKPNALKAGVKAPWQARISNALAFKDVKVQVQASPENDLSRAFFYQEFKAEGVTVAPPGPPFNMPKISGQVINTGQKTATLVGVLVAIYGEDGKLMAVDSTVTKLNEIAPGQTVPFEFSFITAELLKGKKIERYDLFIEGSPKG